MKTFSFFLGSGFSRPAGLESGYELNKLMQNPKCFDIKDFKIQQVTNSSCETTAKELLELFPGIEHFDYEEYYDFIQCLLGSKALDVNCKSELSQLKEKVGQSKLWETLRKYMNQYNLQIASNLQFDPFAKYPQYDLFLNFVRSLLLDGYSINFFTLNHDLFLEHLLKTNKIEYSDGFTLESTEYYYKKFDTNKPIGVFNNHFNKPIKILKLHGSIDQFQFNESMLKASSGDFLNFMDGNDIYRLKTDELLHANFEPAFLTGKNSKNWYLVNHYYYKPLFQKFEDLLNTTDILVFIGYGFKDHHIHKNYLDSFFEKQRKITVCGKDLKNEFLEKYDGRFFRVEKHLEEYEEADYSSFLS